MKLFIFILCLVAFGATLSAQSVSRIDASGNITIEKLTFATEQAVIDHYKLITTSKTVTYPKGGQYKVYQTPRGALVCIKPTKAGGFSKTSIPKPK